MYPYSKLHKHTPECVASREPKSELYGGCSCSHDMIKRIRIQRERAYYGAGQHPFFDARDGELLRERIKARKAITRPLQGDYLILPPDNVPNPDMRRIAHVWNMDDTNDSGVQPSNQKYGSDVYLCKSGAGSFSGGLDGSIPLHRIEDTGRWLAATFWFFHHDHSGAHRGVHCLAPVRVWRVKWAGMECV